MDAFLVVGVTGLYHVSSTVTMYCITCKVHNSVSHKMNSVQGFWHPMCACFCNTVSCGQCFVHFPGHLHHTHLSSTVDMVGPPLLLSTSVLSSQALHHIQNCFHNITWASSISTNWRSMSTAV
jgi:hypothetical protein